MSFYINQIVSFLARCFFFILKNKIQKCDKKCFIHQKNRCNQNYVYLIINYIFLQLYIKIWVLFCDKWLVYKMTMVGDDKGFIKNFGQTSEKFIDQKSQFN